MTEFERRVLGLLLEAHGHEAIINFAWGWITQRDREATEDPGTMEPSESEMRRQSILAQRLHNIDFGLIYTSHIRWHFRETTTVADLLLFSEADLLCLPNIGRKTVKRIREFLAEHALHLRTRDASHDPTVDLDQYLTSQYFCWRPRNTLKEVLDLADEATP